MALFVWARRALNRPFRRFSARAGGGGTRERSYVVLTEASDGGAACTIDPDGGGQTCGADPCDAGRLGPKDASAAAARAVNPLSLVVAAAAATLCIK